MRVNHLLLPDSKTLSISATYQEIVAHFASFPDRAFVAITDGNQLEGALYEEDFQKIEQKDFSLAPLLEKKKLFDYFHILEGIREILKDKKTELPIVDEAGEYLGYCKLEDLQHHFYHTIGIIEGGSLLVLRSTLFNYSLVEVAKIIESHQTKILTHYVSSHPDANEIEITLVLNQSEISDIISTFERFNYQIIYSSTSSDRNDFLKERYDSLMHFLDI